MISRNLSASRPAHACPHLATLIVASLSLDFLIASRMACMGLEFWIRAGHGVLLAEAGTGQQRISKTEILCL